MALLHHRLLRLLVRGLDHLAVRVAVALRVGRLRLWRCRLVLLLVLLVALAQGLEYLLQHSTLGPDFTKGAVIGVYIFGGFLLLFMAKVRGKI
jgi:hypothetical protein